MYEEIIQIIPSPADMRAVFATDVPGEYFSAPVVCLALKEDREGIRFVVPMVYNGRGGFCDVNSTGNFEWLEVGGARV